MIPTAALELNDAGFAIARNGELHLAGPGYAVMTTVGPQFGTAARARRRLEPRGTQRRYWAGLGETPLTPPFGSVRTSADLVEAHLATLWARCAGAQAAILTVMPGWSHEQLALLLGIARDIGMPVAGLVDPAVAVARQPYPGRELWHLQATLDAAWITRLAQDGQGVSLGERERVERCGIEALERGCAEFIARCFLATSRFDPLHDAASEQQLDDALPQWLAAAAHDPRVSARLQWQGNEFEAAIDTGRLRERVAQLADPLLRSLRARLSPREPAVLLLEHRCADFPGLPELLGQLPATTVVLLEPGAAARGALRLQPAAGGDGALALVNALGFDQAPAEGSALPAAAPGRRPTHVLFGHRAWRLGAGPLQVGTTLAEGEYGIGLEAAAQGVSRRHCSLRVEDGRVVVHDHSRYGTRVNGHRIEGTAVLATGDVLTIGEPPQRLTLIEEAERGP